MPGKKKTEERIIRAIADYYLGEHQKKLTIGKVSEITGITRQAFNKSYKHLKPYVKGDRPIEELLYGYEECSRGLLVKCQKVVRILNEKLQKLRGEQEKEIENKINSHITTLMIGDITLRESDVIRNNMISLSQHNDILTKKIHKLERELTLEISKKEIINNEHKQNFNKTLNIVKIDSGLDKIYDKYIRSKKRNNAEVLNEKLIEEFEIEKSEIIESNAEKIKKMINNAVSTRIIIYIERYISSYENFVKNYRTDYNGLIIIVRLPIYNRTELKLFTKRFSKNCYIEVFIPYCDKAVVTKAQRLFFVRNVPDIELDAAENKFQYPNIYDGYDRVTVEKVHQGD